VYALYNLQTFVVVLFVTKLRFIGVFNLNSCRHQCKEFSNIAIETKKLEDDTCVQKDMAKERGALSELCKLA
jgi:hypothetical protein